MKTRFVFKALPIIFVLILVIGCSKVPKFDHYGVYIKGKNDFKEIKGYEWSDVNGIYQNSRDFDMAAIVFENELEIYVYSAKAKINNYNLLIIPSEKNRNGDFVYVDSRFGYNYSKAEITVEPVEKKDDLVIIRLMTIGGIFILHNKDEGKGYLFSSQDITVESEIKQTLSNWVTLLNEDRFVEFIEEYLYPYEIEKMKNNGKFKNTIYELKRYKNNLISELKKMLVEEPKYHHYFLFFDSSSSKLNKDNDKWYKVYESNECYEMANSNRMAIIEDLYDLASSALAFYKTPATHGGGSGIWSSNVDNIGNWLGREYKLSTNKLLTKNGSFELSLNRDILTIVGTGKEIGNDMTTEVKATISITGRTSRLDTTINN